LTLPVISNSGNNSEVVRFSVSPSTFLTYTPHIKILMPARIINRTGYSNKVGYDSAYSLNSSESNITNDSYVDLESGDYVCLSTLTSECIYEFTFWGSSPSGRQVWIVTLK